MADGKALGQERKGRGRGRRVGAYLELRQSPFPIFSEHGSKKIDKTRKKEEGRREEAGLWDPLEEGEKEIYRWDLGLLESQSHFDSKREDGLYQESSSVLFFIIIIIIFLI